MTRSLPFRVWCSLLWYYATRRSSEALISPQVQQAASNLLSICGHLQDENLYSAQWADGLRIIASTDAGTGTSTGTASTITASRKLRQGDILSLFPVQVLRVQDHETQQAQVFSLGAGLPQEILAVCRYLLSSRLLLLIRETLVGLDVGGALLHRCFLERSKNRALFRARTCVALRG